MSIAQNDGSRRFWPVIGIRGQLIVWFALGAVGAVVIGMAVVYVTGVQAIQETLGQTFCQIASRTSGQFSDRFDKYRDLAGGLATDALTTEVALEQFHLYEKHPEVWTRTRIDRLDEEWRAMESDDARRKVLHPQLSHRLSVLAGLEGDLYKRLAVYDIQGLLLASSNVPRTRTARQNSWFEAVHKKSQHFVYVDLYRKESTLLLSTPVWAGTSIVGYVIAMLDYQVMDAPLKGVRFGATGEAHVVDYAGVPLAGTATDYLVQAMTRPPPQERASNPASAGGSIYWTALESEGAWFSWQRLACIAPMQSMNLLREVFDLPPWSIVVTQAPSESYTALEASLKSFLYVGLFGIMVVGFGGAFIAWHITTPLKRLQDGVQQFARGDREYRVEVSTWDEIGALAVEFNRMAERVSDSETELRAFAQAVSDATDAIVITDPESRIYYVNPAFERITGYSAEEAIGETPALIASSRTPRRVFAALRDAMSESLPWRGELWNRRKNGEEYPVDLTVSPIHDDVGNVVSLLGVHRDVTLARAYREQLEKEVEERTREIARTQGLRAMGQMASMIAHDLRNALSTIKMNLQILTRKYDSVSPQSVEGEHCRIGLDQVHYMEDIMRDMLAFARPDQLQADWCDLHKIIDEALLADSQRIVEAGIEVVREGDSDVPKTYCDRSKTLAVLRNLIGNAIQAMPDGGVLSIGISLLMGTEESGVSVAVSDTGSGIPPDVLPQVLEPFFTTRTKGTGLGLAIVKRIIDQHGGCVEVDSDQGRGTTVRFTLPVLPTSIIENHVPTSDC